MPRSIRWVISKDNKFLQSINVEPRKTHIQLTAPISFALMFTSEIDANKMAQRVKGNVIKIKYSNQVDLFRLDGLVVQPI